MPRFDIPLDASPVYRARLERMQRAVASHGTRNAYYLSDGSCTFRFTNDPAIGWVRFRFEGTLLTDDADAKTIGSDLDVALDQETCDWLTQPAVEWLKLAAKHAVEIEFDRYIAAGDLSRALERLARLAADGASPLDEPLVEPPPADPELPEFERSMTPEMWNAAVETAKEHILAGDIFQVVLSQRFSFDLDADPFDFYRVLRQVNPSPYMYFVRTPHLTLAGSSPEPMVKLVDGTVISRPIAGTRRRGRTDEEDRRLGAELREHPKEVAEHVMLIDLARNDVGRVVEFGTETVDEMMILERYSHVMHLTSQVSGRLAAGRTPIDVLRATLPAGTVSGAPKVRAMEIIDDLEPVKRGPYAGVVGYLDFSGTIDTAIAIRTLVVGPDGRAHVQAGAGIVVDSVPEHEDLECRNKARALLSAVTGARRMTAQRTTS